MSSCHHAIGVTRRRCGVRCGGGGADPAADAEQAAGSDGGVAGAAQVEADDPGVLLPAGGPAADEHGGRREPAGGPRLRHRGRPDGPRRLR
eukprot:1017828-Rhodomonas_salina.2